MGGIATGSLEPAEARRVYRSVSFALEDLPKIIRLIEPESTRKFEDSKSQPDSPSAQKEILSIILPEQAGRSSSPARLIQALESIGLIYAACGETQELSLDDLSVIACDSGSDKSFDFLGTAKAIESVKELLLSVWDRVVFHRERKFSERIDLIAKSLPIFDQIGELEKQKKMEPEQAEIVRRKVIEGVTKFLSAGATIPEMEGQTIHSPRVLLAPEPKLLTEASLSPKSDEMHSENSLSPDEEEILRQLIEKQKRQKSNGD